MKSRLFTFLQWATKTLSILKISNRAQFFRVPQVTKIISLFVAFCSPHDFVIIVQ